MDQLISTDIKGNFQGLPIMGPTTPILLPEESLKVWECYGSLLQGSGVPLLEVPMISQMLHVWIPMIIYLLKNG